MTEIEESILLRIRESMKTRKVTQTELAAALNVKQSTVSRMLSGAPFPTVSQLIAIAHRLDVSLYYLLGVQEESYRELSPKAAKIAHAYGNAGETIQQVIDMVLKI